MLPTARDAKGDNARKTEVMDAEWLADLLRHGLLKPSFIPPLPMRELRDVTRYWERLGREQSALANRVQKLSESAPLKLGQGASDALGGSGKLRLRALAAGETAAGPLSPLAQRTRKRQQPQLQQARAGRFTPAQRWMVGQLRDQYAPVEAALQSVAERIRQEVDSRGDPFVPEAVKLLDTLPGMGETVAQIIGAELGVDRERFSTANPLARWAGMGPGNTERAGQRKRGKTTKGRRYVRAALVQAAWAATHQKGTYLAAQYNRWLRRMGKKKALVAVGPSLLVIASHVLQNRTPY